MPAPVGRLDRDDAMVVVGLYYLAKANMSLRSIIFRRRRKK